MGKTSDYITNDGKTALDMYRDDWKRLAIAYFSDYERDEAGKVTGKPTETKFFRKLDIYDPRTIEAIKKAHPDFDETLKYCKNNLLVDVIDDGALLGVYNSSYAQFYLNTRHNIVPSNEISGAISFNSEDKDLLRNVLERLEKSGRGEEDDE